MEAQILKWLPYSAEFNGCCYGLTDEHGDLLRKPWRVASNLPEISELNRHCAGGHPHGNTPGLALIPH